MILAGLGLQSRRGAGTVWAEGACFALAVSGLLWAAVTPARAQAPDAGRLTAQREVKDCEEAVDRQIVVRSCSAVIDRQGADQPSPVIRARAHQKRALARQQIAEYGRSIEDFTAAITLHPNVDAYNLRGFVFFRAGRLDEAVADFQRAVKLDPNSENGWRFLGAALSDKGEATLAFEAFSAGLQVNNRDPWLYFLRGVALAIRGDREGALRDAAEGFQLSGAQSADAYLARGVVAYYLDDLENTERDLGEALKLDPRNVQAMSALGRLLTRRQIPARAAPLLDAALRIDPHQWEALLNRGLLRFSTNDLKGALDDLDRSISLNAAFAEPFATRGQVHEALGARDRAIGDYSTALTKLPFNPDGRRATATARTRLAALSGGLAAVPSSSATPRWHCRALTGLSEHSQRYIGVRLALLGCPNL